MFVALTQVHVAGMSQVLGMSPEQVLDQCRIRELLLYAGTMEQLQKEQGQPAEGVEDLEGLDADALRRRFANEVLGGN